MPPSQLLPAPEESGEGLPYAPENWPEPGDVWGWKTGRRATPTGIYHDRYLYVPVRLSGSEKGGSGRKHRPRFASKLAAERYIKANFPNADIYAFFASFSWKIPASVNGIFSLLIWIFFYQFFSIELTPDKLFNAFYCIF